MAVITPDRVPQPLVDAILKGRCIAFVGVGFSLPAVPGWRHLLAELGTKLDLDVELPANATALEYELVGQALRRKAKTPAAFEASVREILDEHHRRTDPKAVEGRRIVAQRCELLRKIPFKAILTTNFDRWLCGEATGPETYWDVLREDRGRWWEFPLTASDAQPHVPIIKLHGDANGDPDTAEIVLGRADYRHRVYGEHGYTSFIRAAFAEYTVLFLGVSFTDAYLNELRSETLHMLYDPARPRAQPWGYAVMKVAPETRHVPQLFLEYEGIEVLPLEEFPQFDEWLAALTHRTSVQGRLHELLHDEQIVWVDARPENNRRGRALFEACGATVHALTSETQLDPRHAEAALLVTHFGYDPRTRDSRAFRVLDVLRTWPTRPPVIVFASPTAPVAENRRECLRRGAWEYATDWSELYRLIEVLFGRTPGTPAG